MGDEGKEEREGGREKMRTVFIHPVSTNYPCIYSRDLYGNHSELI